MSALDKLQQMRRKAETGTEAGTLFSKFAKCAKAHMGWTAEDVAEYLECAKVLMTGSEQEALALYPSGHYKTAVEARDANIEYWRSTVASFSG